MRRLENVPDPGRTYPVACRHCGQVEVVPTSVKAAKDDAGIQVIYLLCRACHQRWQDAVKTAT